MAEKSTLTQTIRKSHTEMMKSVGTSIPGHILAFDPETQLAQVQIGILRVDVNGQTYTPPPIIECPVQFSGAKFTTEFEIESGDEGLIIFSQRCIDGWVNTGGVAEQPLIRFHDFNDAMFIPGVRSAKTKISNFSNNGIRIRNKAGDHYVWLKGDGTIEQTNGAGVFTMNPDGSVVINGCTIGKDGNVTTASGISLNDHTHPGVQTGPGSTGPAQ